MRMFEYMNECERVDIKKVIKWCDNIKCDCLIVKHDKDKRDAHYHCFIRLVADREIEDIANQLETDKQYIQFVRKWKNALAYAFHLTDNAKNDGKYQYDKNAVVYSKNVDIDAIFDNAVEYDNQKQRYDEIKQYLYQYGNCEITKAKLLSYLTAEDYDKFANSFRRMQEYRIMKVRDRQMQVIYICGGAGTGKTTLAKYMAQTMRYDYFVSGSGKDVLDGYDKEECIILDDLRADAFTKAELFKLTDNNTNSSVKSRFRNKDISYCKLMIITSVKRPTDLYNWETESQENKDESFKQFARRLGNCFLFIADNGVIYECRYQLDNYFGQTEKKVCPYTMNNVFTALGISQMLGKDLVNQILNKVNESLEDAKKQAEEELPF